jgi:hypothetical protein
MYLHPRMSPQELVRSVRSFSDPYPMEVATQFHRPFCSWDEALEELQRIGVVAVVMGECLFQYAPTKRAVQSMYTIVSARDGRMRWKLTHACVGSCSYYGS